MNKPVYLGLSISQVSKTVMYDLWFDYVKPKNGEKAKLSYMDTDSFKVYIKTEKICVDITKDVEIRFHTSKYELDRPLPKENRKTVIGLMKNELSGKTMAEFSALRPKTYSYLTDDNNENKKLKWTEKCIIKRKLKFEDHKQCLEANQLENEISKLEQINLI